MSTDVNSELFGRAIDVHGHLVPEFIFEDHHEELGEIGISTEVADGSYFLMRGSDKLGPIRPGMSKTSKRLEWMDSRGIHEQWVSPWMDLFTWTSFSESEVLKWYEIINASMSKSADLSSGRLGALGALHLADPERVVNDLPEQVKKLNWTGLMLNTHPGEISSLTQPELSKFWEAVEKSDLPVLLHPPSNGPSCQITPNLLQNITGRLVDTTMLITEMILSGFMERFPKLKLIVVHGGGLLPYQSFRLDGLHRAGLMPQGSPNGPISEQLSKFFYDTVALDPLSIELLVSRVGIDRVLLGSDAPFPIADPDPLRSVLETKLDESAKTDICCNNANHLVAAEGSTSAS